jgi:hypothetical protein
MNGLQPYQEFQESLLQITEHLASDTYSMSELQTALAHLQTILQQRIQPILELAWDAPMLHRLQSYQVEMDKQLRLAKLDLLFLRSAQQGPTQQQRLMQLQERIDKLGQYCTAVLASAQPLVD